MPRTTINIPAFDKDAYPPNEHAHIDFCYSATLALAEYLKDIDAAFQLFDEAKARGNQQPWDRWQMIAGRDGAMSIYHFSQTLLSIRSGMKGCPKFSSLVDHDQIKKSRKRFAKSFPVAEHMRHAIAHSADMMLSLEKFSINLLQPSEKVHFAEDIGATVVKNYAVGKKFGTTFEGKLITYEISPEVRDELLEILAGVYSAFSQVDINPLKGFD